MATDNKQKVLIRSMSTEEIEKYLINSDLNGKIIPKNKDTWHQDFSDINLSSTYSYIYIATILTNITANNYMKFFINRHFGGGGGTQIYTKNFTKNTNLYTILSGNDGWIFYYEALSVFRPLIEYKE